MNIPFTKKIAQVAFAAIATLFLASCENPLLVEATGLYTVKFETNCPTQIDSYRTNKIEKIQILEKQDAQFIGWYTNASFSGSAVSFPYELSSDTTFYAKWNQKYTVRFETNGGTEIPSYKTAEIAEMPLTTKSDCQLAGWYLSADFSGKAVEFPLELTEPLILYAKWTQFYIATFVTNGGTAVSAQKTATISESPYSTKKGYLCAGWYLDEEFSIPISYPFTLTEDTVFYAKWVEATNTAYTVEHYKQDENLSTYSLIDTEQSSGTTNSQTNAKPKSYTGFHTTELLQKTISADGLTVVKIYYNRNSYTVRFDANGGSGEMNEQIFYYGIAQTLPKNTFTLNNYAFIGWSNSITSNVLYSDKEQVLNLTTENNATITLYARWFYGASVNATTVSELDLSNLTESYTVRVTGDITTSTLEKLATKIKTAKFSIYLDLSNATGITEISGNNTQRTSIFSECTNLTSISLPKTLKTIGANAFQYCSIKSVIIPNSVTVIGTEAFFGCGLVSIEIGNCVTSIGSWAFGNCSSLTSVSIPSSVESIAECAFYALESLTSVQFLDSSSSWLCMHSDPYLAQNGYKATVSVSNSALNAKNLKDTYSSYIWTKK